MLSCAKVNMERKGQSLAYTAPLVKNEAELTKVDYINYNYATQGISSDIELDYHLAGNKQLNFD